MAGYPCDTLCYHMLTLSKDKLCKPGEQTGAIPTLLQSALYFRDTDERSFGMFLLRYLQIIWITTDYMDISCLIEPDNFVRTYLK